MIVEVIIMRDEEKKPTSQKSKIQRILTKRWALPAIYIASAAIILAIAFGVQNSFNDSTNDRDELAESSKNFEQPSIEVNSQLESIKMPVANSLDTVIKTQFYDKNADKEDRAQSLVFYNNRYLQNKGIDIAAKDGEEFEVVASLSGYVTNVKEDSLLGNTIEIEHDNGVITRYQSVKDYTVAVGDQVKQGEAIATSGKSLMNEEAGTHVHFEIRKEETALNPLELIDIQLSAVQLPEQTNEEPTEAAEDDAVKDETGEQDASTKESEENPANSEQEEGEENTTDSEKESKEPTESGTDSETDPDSEEDADSSTEINEIEN
jgi:stage II sporulation protein Q